MTPLPSLRPPTTVRSRSVAALLVVVLVALLVPAGAARAAGDPAADLTRWIGDERAAAGVGGLRVAGDLVDVATRHAHRMASEGRLHHNPALSSEVQGWQRVTENVGTGPEARAVHDAFMASSSHRANIVDGQVTEVGVGVASSDGTLWVVQVFRLPTAASEPAPPPPPPAPDPEPTPVPDAAPAPSAPSVPAPPTTPAPSATPSAPAPVSEQAVVLVLDEVAPAPAPSVTVGTADVGSVAEAPTPPTVHVLTATRWLAVLAALMEG